VATFWRFLKETFMINCECGRFFWSWKRYGNHRKYEHPYMGSAK